VIAMPQNPLLRVGLIVALLGVSIGVARAVYIIPRESEARSLRAEGARLRGELEDYGRGLQEMESWSMAHSGQAADRPIQVALPAERAVASFLEALAPIADRHGVRTDRIEPVGATRFESMTDGSGGPAAYRIQDLRFHLRASYRDLAACIEDLETLDQLVLVRSISLRYAAGAYPALDAEMTVRVFGAL
jgi:hypothetical protein